MPKVIFIMPDGEKKEIEAAEGLSILEVARQNDIPIEGACEGSLACSTCHVIVDEPFFDILEEASEDEEDMLDLAFGLTPTSRLGCQIRVSEEIDGIAVKVPDVTKDASVA